MLFESKATEGILPASLLLCRSTPQTHDSDVQLSNQSFCLWLTVHPRAPDWTGLGHLTVVGFEEYAAAKWQSCICECMLNLRQSLMRIEAKSRLRPVQINPYLSSEHSIISVYTFQHAEYISGEIQRCIWFIHLSDLSANLFCTLSCFLMPSYN